ncbi:MAG: GntR family transcriptional regulator [Angelakisella sp.]|jgi:GntR family transcriptional regulator|nr:GntR family transcriptional regulator [Angelakisella sp.]
MIAVDLSSRVPIYRQIVERVTELVLLGVWPEGTQLPSVRSLALELGTNPNTIQKAYQELENRGIIRSAAGRGSFVAGREAAQGILRAQAESSLREAAQKAVLAGLTREEAARLIDEAWKGEGKP